MKRGLIVTLIATIAITSCKKETEDLRAIGSYTVINATTDVANIKAYAAEQEISWSKLPATDAAAQYRAVNFGAWAGLNIFRSVNAADTTMTIFNSSKPEDFKQGKMNSIFLCGNATAGYNGVFLQNEEPVNYTGDVVGIRFINLSPNAGPFNITLATSPTTNEASNLAYKQSTNFKEYAADQSIVQYDFQLRDAANTVLSTYTLKQTQTTSPYTTVSLAYARKKTITLVIKGLQGGSGTTALGIFPVPHY